jgi:hypothetical protein
MTNETRTTIACQDADREAAMSHLRYVRSVLLDLRVLCSLPDPCVPDVRVRVPITRARVTESIVMARLMGAQCYPESIGSGRIMAMATSDSMARAVAHEQEGTTPRTH